MGLVANSQPSATLSIIVPEEIDKTLEKAW
jgi:hypothetical protein